MKLTGFSLWWVQALAREGRLPCYSRKPLWFSVQDIDKWVCPKNLEQYSEFRVGLFGGMDKPRNPSSREW